MIRRIVLMLGAAVLATAVWASPAYAHGSVVLTLHGDGRGSVWVTAVWSDGDAISEPIGAVLTATSASGLSVGPVALQSNGGRLTYGGRLAAGDWTVTAEMGTPAIGRCQATMHVNPAAAAAPSETRCAPPPAAASTPAPAPASSSHAGWYVALAVVGSAAMLGLFFFARRS